MHDGTTMCIVHAGFRGFRTFVPRKKSRCKLIGNRFVIPHSTYINRYCDTKSYYIIVLQSVTAD